MTCSQMHFVLILSYKYQIKSVILFIFLFSMMLISCNGNNLYDSEMFTVKSDRVIQGRFEALAHSTTEITSNYRSDYRMPTKREVFFKFSLNGNDNERFPGEDHRILLETENGHIISEIYTFGEPDPPSDGKRKIHRDPFLNQNISVTFRCDMRAVLNAFERDGYFVTVTGDRIDKKDLIGLYIAGNMLPLTWDFANLSNNPSFEMTDPDGDGIYELTLEFSQYQEEPDRDQQNRRWNLNSDLKQFPELGSPHILIDALYNLALEELLLNIRDDGAFMAGKKWPGVWTRDISYSILLSLAALAPEESKNSLKAKVFKDCIIQDTGTGGSWPISTDRLTWALAAWELYKVNGDKSWLEYAYNLIKNSAETDLVAAFDAEDGLFYGESSFLDWREQTYPRWMDPKDIYQSFSLGTNTVHYQTYRILARMSEIMGYNPHKYSQVADAVSSAINKKMWQNDAGYYGQYLYGRNFHTLSERSETLGEALCILFEIADSKRQSSIIEKMPLTPYGPTCIFPQIPDIPPYHNNGIWPFVVAYWTWAAAQTQNSAAVEYGLASIIRAAALFLTNKENFVAATGDYMGTEINSDRQLWSVAGYLATIYRVLFGISFEENGLTFRPFIPQNYGGTWVLNGFKYREATLQITIDGYGSTVSDFYLDGVKTDRAFIPSDLSGNHSVHLKLANNELPSKSPNIVENKFTPATPLPILHQGKLEWQSSEEDKLYRIYINGEKTEETIQTSYMIRSDDILKEYQVQTVDENHLTSFLSAPIQVLNKSGIIRAEIEKGRNMRKKEHGGYSGDGYLKLTRTEHTMVDMPVEIKDSAVYSIDFRYANGSGPINTNNKCAIRSFYLNGNRRGVFVFPQRGTDNWTDWGYSNSIRVELSQGLHRFQLLFEKENENMNSVENTFLLDQLRLMKISLTE